MNTLVWLHEESIKIPDLPPSANPVTYIHIWDNAYLMQRNYTLKRLVFIYESLIQLPIEIYQGPTIETIRALSPTKLLIPQTHQIDLCQLIHELKTHVNTEIIPAELFSSLEQTKVYTRFFKYWNHAKKDILRED